MKYIWTETLKYVFDKQSLLQLFKLCLNTVSVCVKKEFKLYNRVLLNQASVFSNIEI